MCQYTKYKGAAVANGRGVKEPVYLTLGGLAMSVIQLVPGGSW